MIFLVRRFKKTKVLLAQHYIADVALFKRPICAVFQNKRYHRFLNLGMFSACSQNLAISSLTFL